MRLLPCCAPVTVSACCRAQSLLLHCCPRTVPWVCWGAFLAPFRHAYLRERCALVRGEQQHCQSLLWLSSSALVLPGPPCRHAYLKERRAAVRGLSVRDPRHTALNNAFERALVTMHRMPRIWIEYLGALVDDQKLITRARRTFDRALRSLPPTQHERLWEPYLKFVKQPQVRRRRPSFGTVLYSTVQYSIRMRHV